MAVNKMEYKQVRRYLFLMILACAIYLFYSIIVVYYNTQALKSGPIKSFKVVSEHRGAINITSYIIVHYMGKDYTVTISRKDINEGNLHKILYHNKWNDTLFYDEMGDIYVRLGILSLGLLSVLCMRHYIKDYHGNKK
ncbi:hypothetical protein [Prevotella sp. F0091]|uniref:hypothetical protein n=1 Tax=Prevotella sp. F0091 TaxID=1227276 RepID=UPI0003ACF729|nr:hypothetical protein [Prevotella sp. F0091]ERJ74732.1 hypothetical protein HMPREF9148_02271 [Prevotella sp. F0091]